MGTPKRWTDREKRIVQEKPHKESCRLLPHRTPGTIQTMRHKLKRPERFARRDRPWTDAERLIVKRHYPTDAPQEMQARLPGRSPQTIRELARRLKLKKVYCGCTTDTLFTKDGQELCEQIKMRAKQDGIVFAKLDKLLGTGFYFERNWKRGQTRVNLIYVKRAVDFFGGKLVIDWNDR